MNKKFKDECDKCHKMKECKGYHKLVLCEECKNIEQKLSCNTICDENNQVKFDL